MTPPAAPAAVATGSAVGEFVTEICPARAERHVADGLRDGAAGEQAGYGLDAGKAPPIRREDLPRVEEAANL